MSAAQVFFVYSSVYPQIILEFLFELYVFYFIILYKLKPEKHFFLKFFGGFLAVAAVAQGFAFLYYFYGNTVPGRILIYFALFVLSMVHIRLCHIDSAIDTVFMCSIAYAAQNFFYKVYLLFWVFGWQFDWFDGWGDMFFLYYRIFYYILFFAVLGALYFAVIAKVRKKYLSGTFNYKMLALSLITLVITIIICSVEDICFLGLSSAENENSYADFNHFVLRQVGNVHSVLSCYIVLLLLYKSLEEVELKREVAYLQYAVSQAKKQYEISKETMDIINVKCHDIKYRISDILSVKNEVTSELIGDLQQNISIYDCKADTGNDLLNVLFTEKSLYCEKNGIQFSCMADGSRLSFFKDADLYCLFSNILDNALEAVKKIENVDKRVISITVKIRNNMLIVEEENYYEGELSFRNGVPVTTKPDKTEHGYGIRSIRMIVGKYGGEVSISAREGRFCLTILFPDVGDQGRTAPRP